MNRQFPANSGSTSTSSSNASSNSNSTSNAAVVLVVVLRLILILLLSMPTALPARCESGQTVQISAKRFSFTPSEIVLKKGVPVTLQITSEDRSHGFNIPSMKVRADVAPGKVTELKVTPQQSGSYDFFCDVFCGGGHESMSGKIVVKD